MFGRTLKSSSSSQSFHNRLSRFQFQPFTTTSCFTYPSTSSRVSRKIPSSNLFATRNKFILSSPRDQKVKRLKNDPSLLRRNLFIPPFNHNENNKCKNIAALRSTPDDNYEYQSNHEYDVILDGLNDAQIEAVTQPIQSITRVIAGPGAGKTRVLTCRIAYLLKSDTHDNQSRILAVTFTKKAASEMQHRLDALLREDEDYQKSLEGDEMLGGDNNDAHDDGDADDDNDEIIEEVVQSNDPNTRSTSYLSSRVTLGTFHSICAKILRWNGQEISKLPSLQTYLPKISSSSSTDEEEGGTSSSSEIATTLDSSFAIIDQSEQMRIIKQCLTERGIDLKGTGRAGQSDIRPVTILNAVSQIKSDDAMGVMFSGASSSDGDDDDGGKSNGRKMSRKVRQIAEEVYPMYRKALLSQNSLDFDDLILLTRELLKINPDVRERIQKRWTHVLVDEFQDTSEAQLDIVKLLTTSSLLIVGDGDQSIYSWRGAHAESMSDFVKAFDNNNNDNEGNRKEVDTVFLMENYRSTTNIVKAAQKVISNTSTEDSPQDDIRKDMKPMRGKGPSPRVLACSDSKSEATFVVKEILKMEQEGTINSSSTVALIYRTNAQSRALEEACVAENLQYLVRGSAGTFYSRAEIKDCLCFLRWIYNGRDQSAMIRAMKTPSRGLGDKSVEEFVSYCKQVEENLLDSGMEPATPFDILLSLAGKSSPYISPEKIISKRTLNRLVPFASQMKKIRDKAETQTVSDLLGSIIDVLDLKPHFDSISKTSEEFADRLANVNELRGASERYSKDGPCLDEKQHDDIVEMSPLGNFLDDVSLLTDVEPSDDDTESGERRLMANLMTIHASKGMEFDCVFLVGNEEGTFPTQRSITEGEGSVELDEERRLCYVAMTRAKTHLVMTWRREVQTFFGQGFKYTHPERSRFLDRLVSKKSSSGMKKKQANPAARGSRRQFNSYAASTGRQYTGVSRGYSMRDRSPIKRKKAPIRNSADFQLQFDDERPSPRQRITKTKTKTKKKKKKSIKAKPQRRIESQNDSNNSSQRTLMDSSLFFPVGCVVHHNIHGEGVVLQPKAVQIGETMKVSVDFKSGMKVDFPVQNSGLRMKH